MGREGWIYLVVFVAVLAGGALLIAPRLGRGPPDRDTSAPGDGPGATPSGSTSAAGGPRSGWTVVTVRGEAGPLRGPLKEVRGAETQPLGPASAPEPRLRVRPVRDDVAFGAAGHQWRVVSAAALAEVAEVVLPLAAPPIVLRVREPDGRPAVSVPVYVRPTVPGEVRRTDEGGTVVIDDVPVGLVLVDAGGAERRGPSLRLVAGEDRDVRITLEPAWHIQGVVLDGRGAPLPDAEVRVLGEGEEIGRPVGTDEQGRFAWVGPVHAAAAVRVAVPGLADVSVKASPPAHGALLTDVGEIALTRAGGKLVGRVVSSAPEDEILVRAEPQVAAPIRELFGRAAVVDAPRRVRATSEGTFVLEGLPPDLPFRVSIRGAFLPIDPIVRAGIGEELHQTWTPPPGHLLEGRVLAAGDGASVAGLPVRVATTERNVDGPAPGDRMVRTDADGRFRLTGLPRGPLFLRAYPSGGRRPLLRRVDLPRAEPLDLVAAPELGDAAHRLSGVVVDEMNTPLPGVTVSAAGRAKTTDAEGRFLLRGVEAQGPSLLLACAFEPGTRPVGIDPRPFAAGVRRRVSPGGEPLKLVLPRTRDLGVRVVDGLDDQPLSFVQVVVRTDDGELLVDRAVAPVDGRLRLHGLAPRGLILGVFSHAHRLVRPIPLNALEAQDLEVDLGTLALAHGIRIEGRIVDPRGTGVPGARIGGMETGWLRMRSPDPTLRRELALRHTVTDAEGRFVIEGFDPRRPAMLAAWAPGFAPTGRRVVLEKFKEDVRVSLTVQVRHGGYLAVELLEAGTERPLSGALLDLEDARNGSDYLDLLRRGMLGGAIGSDRDWRLASIHLLPEGREPGLYRIGPVEPGPYEVWVDRPGYVILRRKLTILDPKDGLIDLTRGTSRELTEDLQQTWKMEPAP